MRSYFFIILVFVSKVLFANADSVDSKALKIEVIGLCFDNSFSSHNVLCFIPTSDSTIEQYLGRIDTIRYIQIHNERLTNELLNWMNKDKLFYSKLKFKTGLRITEELIYLRVKILIHIPYEEMQYLNPSEVDHIEYSLILNDKQIPALRLFSENSYFNSDTYFSYKPPKGFGVFD